MASGDGLDMVEIPTTAPKPNLKKNTEDIMIVRQSSTSDAANDKEERERPTSMDNNKIAVSGGSGPTKYGKSEKERKIGHRRVGEGGEITYKKIQTTQIMGSIQLGIQHTVGSLASKPKRDLLMMDFWEIESISFPPDGSSLTPAHHYSEFRFKIYAPIAFRYFRDLFGIEPDDFMMSMCSAPLRELSNPGASGSIFYLTDDDEFIIKTVQHKEGEFLQKLLPGYYMNLNQNPRTLLPKFFGLYCFQCNAKNVRLVAMNNLLPSDVKMHLKYDLKGSTYKRKANKAERLKKSPTYKDLDFMEHHPNGIFLESEMYSALVKTIQRDCTVLESFKIMDYSLLLGIHNLDTALKEKQEERDAKPSCSRQDESDLEDAPEADQCIAQDERERGGGASVVLNRSRSINRQRLVAHSTAMESIQASTFEPIDEEEDVPSGGIPARSESGERLLLYIGVIDILQSYRLKKKLEHTFKSIFHDGETVSVCRPSFYAQRFQNFMAKTVFKKIPSTLKHYPSKRKNLLRSAQKPSLSESDGDRHRRPIPSGSTTPPPPFDDIGEGNSQMQKVKFASGSKHIAGPTQYNNNPNNTKTTVSSSTNKSIERSVLERDRNSVNSNTSASSTTVTTTSKKVQLVSALRSTYKDDAVSISEIRLDTHLAVDTSSSSNYGSRGALSWTPPASYEGSTPTWTEGTPSYTDSSDSGGDLDNSASQLNILNSTADFHSLPPVMKMRSTQLKSSAEISKVLSEKTEEMNMKVHTNSAEKKKPPPPPVRKR